MEDNTENLLKKYREKLSDQVKLKEEYFPNENFSIEYKLFRKANLEKNLSRYEKLCNTSENIIKVSPGKKDVQPVSNAIEKLHLGMTPVGAMSFAVLASLSIIMLGVILLAISLLLQEASVFIPLGFMLLGVLLIKPLSKYPLRLESSYRLKVSNQVVLCILYIVTYMRHTSNLENAIKFAGEHLQPPLSLDLRKILYDVEVGTYVTIKESLDNYLKYWRPYNIEFIESFHLIEGSLYEGDEKRRIKLLDKSLETILQSTYERMLHYAQELKTPITMLHMLGVILPILGLVIFPLLGSFLGGLVKWYHVAFIYNLLLPLVVYSVGNNLLIKRPTGFTESEVQMKKIPEKQKSNLRLASIFIASFFILIGMSPLIIHFINPGLDNADFLGFKLLDYKCSDGKCTGPYSTFSMLLSLFVPLGIALAISLYYYQTTKDVIKIRKETLDLEKEFTSALFQLGNRIGDGIPVEAAFGQVARNMQNTPSGNLLRIIDGNIRSFGMSVKNAIFNKEKGAINYYPSSLIESSMKVLIQSAKKSPETVSKSLITISNYVKRIHRVGERLKDLLADIISSMKSQVSFLTPMIAGIVVAVGSMITTIINQLGDRFKEATEFAPETAGAGLAALPNIIKIEDVIPGFYFQLVIAVYIIQIGIILTILSSGIERGIDRLTEKNLIGKNVLRSILLYLAVSVIGIIIFSLLAQGITKEF